MSLWFRAGPFSASTRGRVGVRVGPVGYTTGGRRRRQSESTAAGWVALFILALVAVAVLAVVRLVILGVVYVVNHWMFVLAVLLGIWLLLASPKLYRRRRRARAERRKIRSLRHLLEESGGRIRKSEARKAGFSTSTIERAMALRGGIKQSGSGKVGDPYFLELVSATARQEIIVPSTSESTDAAGAPLASAVSPTAEAQAFASDRTSAQHGADAAAS
jgi:hypothetical protein